MKFPKFLSLCLCVLYLCSKVLCSLYLTERDLRTMKGKFCGPNLSGALSLVCHGKYNSPPPQKKSTTEDDEDVYDYPFIAKRNVFSFLTDGISKRGIVDECCLKSCTLAELQSYCR